VPRELLACMLEIAEFSIHRKIAVALGASRLQTEGENAHERF
jgi:hypothetical protein